MRKTITIAVHDHNGVGCGKVTFTRDENFPESVRADLELTRDGKFGSAQFCVLERELAEVTRVLS